MKTVKLKVHRAPPWPFPAFQLRLQFTEERRHIKNIKAITLNLGKRSKISLNNFKRTIIKHLEV